jgi:hypothetical protein
MGKKRKEQKTQTLEEWKATTISQAMDNCIPANIPLHRRFKVGDAVRVGALENAIVEEVLEGGLIYLIRHGQRKVDANCLTAFPWMSVKPLNNELTTFADEYDLRANYSNTCMDGLIGKVYHFGVDFTPSYQRGLVWTQEQKEALIQTIFDLGSIGTFAFNRRPYTSAKPLYEVIDGKQRLSTLCEFYEDRWPYKGVYYSQLSGADTTTFRMTSVLEVTLQEATEEQQLRLFLRINRAGTPVDVKHIAHVQAMLDIQQGKNANG